MALLSLQAFKTKWAAITGRFKDNNIFDIAEKDYREFSTDIADSLFEPVESLRTRVEKLEQPAPAAPEGIKWVKFPKVSVVGDDVLVTLSEADFKGAPVEFQPGTAKENVPLPPAGWGERIDILAATATGWVYIYGQDPGVTPAFVHPDQPDTELLFAAYLFWSNAGGAVEEPVVFVRVVEMDGQEYTPDANGRLLLPKGGITINSTDDIQNEGAVNKWFTDTRVYLAKATGYVIQGTARAITQNDSLMMILGIFENRLNLLGTGKQDKLTYDNVPTQGSISVVTSGGIHGFVNNSLLAVQVYKVSTTQLFRELDTLFTKGIRLQALTTPGFGLSRMEYQVRTIGGAVLPSASTFYNESGFNAAVAGLSQQNVDAGYDIIPYVVPTAGAEDVTGFITFTAL